MAKAKKFLSVFLIIAMMVANLSPVAALADTTKPMVVSSNLSIDPVAGYSTNVDVGINPTIVFSKDMDNSSSGLQSAYSVYLYPVGSTSLVSISKVYDSTSKTLTIIPSTPLTPGKAYRLTLSGGYCKDKEGNSIVANFDNNQYLMYFSTTGAAGDIIPPVLIGSSITEGDINLPTSFTATLSFNEAMNKGAVEQYTLLEEQVNSYTYTSVSASVTYDDALKTATIKSTAPLKENKYYRIHIVKNSAKDAAGIAMEERVINFKTGTSDNQPPKIVSTSISDGGTALVSTKFTVTFDEDLDTTLNYTNFLGVTKNGQTVDISNWGSSSVDIDGRTLYLPGKYSTVKWDYSSTYVITIKKGIKDKVGNATTQDYTYTFTTPVKDTVAPTITSMTPDLTATDINTPAAVGSLRQAITVNFSEPISGYHLKPILSNISIMYSNSLDSNGNPYWQKIKDTSGNDAYTITSDCPDPGTFSKPFTTFTITPTIDLKENTKYQLYITVTDIEGNILAKDKYFFMPKLGSNDTTPPTVTSSYPEKRDYLNRPLDIPVGVKPTVKFSEAMDKSTINTSNIYVATTGLNPSAVAATLSYDDSTETVTITPDMPLNQLTEYVLIVKNVKDLARNLIASDYEVNFKTVQTDFIGPQIAGTYPAANTTGAAIDKAFEITFNEPIKYDMNVFNANVIVKEGSTVIPPSKVSGDNGLYFSVGGDNGNVLKIYRSKVGTNIWSKGQQYTITVKTGLVDSYNNPMVAERSWSFRTIDEDTVKPTIVSMNPDITSGTEEAPAYINTLRPEFKVAFSEAMDGHYINLVNRYVEIEYYLSDGTGGAWYAIKTSTGSDAFTVSSNGSVSTSFTELTIKATKDLEPNKKYRLHMVVGDLQYNILDKVDYYFVPRSGSSTDYTLPTVVDSYPKKVDYNSRPLDIDPASIFTVKFSEDMDEATINSSNVYVGRGDFLTGNIIKTPGTVIYDKQTFTATFKPNAPLNQNTEYALIVDNVFDLSGNKIDGEWSANFKTAITDKTGPVITGVYPANNTTGSAINRDFTITFNKAIENSMIMLNNNIIVKENGTVIDPSQHSGDGGIICTISNGNVVKITRSVAGTNLWKKGADYTITVKAGLVDTLGNQFGNDYTWSFRTIEADTVIPTITSMTPDITRGTEDNPTLVNDPRPVFNIKFSEPMNGYYINPINRYVQIEYYLSDSTGGAWYPAKTSSGSDIAVVTSNGSVDTSFTELTITLNQDLVGTKKYRLHLVVGDLQYNIIEKTDYYFVTSKTEDTTPPAVELVSPTPNTTGAAIDVYPSVTFSEKLNEASVTQENIGLYKGTTRIDSKLVYEASLRKVTIQPLTALDINTVYTIVVNTGITDLAGNNLINGFTSSFTTGSQTERKAEVESLYAVGDDGGKVDITNGGNDVPASAKFELLFNQLLDETSLKTGSTEYIYITENADGSRDVETTGQVTSKVSTVGTKTKIVLEGMFGMPIALYSGRTYYLVVTDNVKDKKGNRLDKRIIAFNTTEANKVVSVSVDKYLINGGITVVAPAEVGINPKKIIITTKKDILASDIDYAIKLWQENGTAYGVIINAPITVSGNTAVIDLTNITLKADTTYKLQIKSDLLSTDGATLDKNYTFWFKPVGNPTDNTEGNMFLKGNNIVKKGEQTEITVSTDIMKVKTLDMKLTYDVKEISVVSAKLTDELNGKNATIVIEKNSDGSEKGQITISIKLDSEISIADIAKITLESLNGNKTVLSYNGDIIYTKGDDIPKYAKGNNLIIMGKTYDLNGDGKINILDVLMVTRMIGIDKNSQEWDIYRGRDINEDGKIDEADADAISAHLGEVAR